MLLKRTIFFCSNVNIHFIQFILLFIILKYLLKEKIKCIHFSIEWFYYDNVAGIVTSQHDCISYSKASKSSNKPKTNDLYPCDIVTSIPISPPFQNILVNSQRWNYGAHYWLNNVKLPQQWCLRRWHVSWAIRMAKYDASMYMTRCEVSEICDYLCICNLCMHCFFVLFSLLLLLLLLVLCKPKIRIDAFSLIVNRDQ